MNSDNTSKPQRPHVSLEQSVEALQRRLGKLDRRQIQAWRSMRPYERLEIAFQAYQFALEAVRVTERRRHPELSEEKLNWRVTRRMQGNQKLGREVSYETR